MTNSTISIITVTYNAADVLQRTFDSIQSQTAFNAIEHIVIDGNSKDNTVEIIKANEHNIAKWISEADNGLYDAMNKGLAMATGAYVWFVNAGDEIYNSNTSKNILPLLSAKPDILYGETMEYSASGDELGKRRLKAPATLNWKTFKQGMLVCHQSILIRKDIADNYNTKYSLAADIDWVIKALKKSKSVINSNLILSKFEKGGLSSQHIKRGLKERFAIMKDHYGIISTLLHHSYFPFRLAFFYFKNKRI